MSSAVLRQLDEIISRLEESERVYPRNEDGFFEDKRFSHLLVQTKELDDLIALIKLSLSAKYGPDSPHEALLSKASDHGWNHKESIFRYYINWLRRVRGIVVVALPEAPEPAAGITVNVGRDMVGSAVGGTNATVTTYGQEVTIDADAVLALISLIDDLTRARMPESPGREEIDAIKADLRQIAEKKTASVSRLQGLVERVKTLGSDIFSNTTAAILADQIKSLIG